MTVDKIIFVAVGACIAGLFLLFLGDFCRRAFKQRRALSRSVRALATLHGRTKGSGGHLSDLTELRSTAMAHNERLSHLWDEFADTLHEQPSDRLDEDGQPLPGRHRQTMPAETYFSSTTLIEVPLRTEFYKHLPGVLTGLGIIGTFTGLIFGLSDFDISFGQSSSSSPPAQVQPVAGQGSQQSDQAVNGISDNVDDLLQSVVHAFIVSASAIALAMLVTLVEKRILASLIVRVERLCETLDAMFDAGAGEEYLAELVDAARTSATQTQQLKDALISDLRELLHDMTDRQIQALQGNVDRQIEATNSSAEVIATRVADRIETTLREPLDQISAAVGRTSADQGEALGGIMKTVVAQLDDMLGSQLRDIADLMTRTDASMQATLVRFDEVADSIGGAGRRAADDMSSRIAEVLESASQRQAELNATMREFVAELRGSLLEGQSETTRVVQGLVERLNQDVAAVVGELRSTTEASQAQERDRHRAVHEETQQSMAALQGQIAALVASNAKVTDGMAVAMHGLSSGTSGAVAHLDESTRRLASTVERIAGAGNDLGDALRGAEQLAGTLGSATDNVSRAIDAARESVEQHRQSNQATSAMLTELRTLIDAASRDASVTEQLVSTLEGAANQLIGAQRGVEDYVPKLTTAMEEAHSEFARLLRDSLQQGNGEFHVELERAVGLLQGAVKDFGDVVDDIAGVADSRGSGR